SIESTAIQRYSFGRYQPILAGIVGNVMEWYDFTAYGYFASVIGRNFFPSTSPLESLIAAFGVFAAGFLMRPVGSLIFGQIGDRMTRAYRKIVGRGQRGRRAGQSRGSSERGTPSGQGCDVAIVSRQRTSRRASVARNGLAVAYLAWAACCDWNDAVRSSQCRRFAAPHPADRCHRHDR